MKKRTFEISDSGYYSLLGDDLYCMDYGENDNLFRVKDVAVAKIQRYIGIKQKLLRRVANASLGLGDLMEIDCVSYKLYAMMISKYDLVFFRIERLY